MSLPAENAEAPQSALVLRRRTGWEACDSGVLLWRKNFLPVFLFAACPVLVFALASRLLTDAALVSCAILFWLKPLSGRLALHVISIRFFQPGCPVRGLFPGLGRSVLRGLPGDLLWRRFSPWRAARLPVRVLENPGARAYRRRISSLREGNLPFCFFLTVFCVALEIWVFAGETGFLFAMLNIAGDGFSLAPREFFSRFAYVLFALWCFNLVLVESLYAAMGFGLYIGSRVEVEGWDIQLLFQKAVRSARPVSGGVVKVFMLFAFLAAFASGEARADQAPAAEYASPPLDKNIEKELEKVFASPDFGGETDTWEIRRRGAADAESGAEGAETDSGLSDLFSSLKKTLRNFREFFGSALRAVLVVCVAAAAGFVLFRYCGTKRKGPPRPSKPRARSAGGVPPDKPDSLLEKSAGLYVRGEYREAWALCLAAAFRAYTVSRGIVFPAGATEYGCLSLVRGAGEDASGGFARLVGDWVMFAYAGRVPPEKNYEEARAFCRSLLSAGEGAAHA